MVSASFVLAILISTYFVVAALPGSVAGQAGTYSGSMNVNWSGYGVSITGTGQWGFTVDASDNLNGGSSFQISETLPPVGDCTISPSTLGISDREIWTGPVQGTVATIHDTGSVSFSTDSLTISCPGSSSYTVSLGGYSTPFSTQFTMDLSQLENGGATTYNANGIDETLTLNRGPPTITTQQVTTNPTSTTSTQPFTTQSQPTTVQTTTDVCGEGYHLGGIPGSQNSLICVPNGGLVAVDEGSANVVDLSGKPVPEGTPVAPGDIVSVGSNSMITLNTGSSTFEATGGTVAMEQQLTCSDGTCTISPDTTQPDVSAQLLSEFLQLGANVDTELMLHALGDVLVEQAAEATAVTAGVATVGPVVLTVFTVGTIGYETYQYIKSTSEIVSNAETAVPAGYEHVGTCEQVGTSFVCDPGASLTIADGRNGTMISDLTGSSFVINMANMQSTTLSAGQRVFVPSNQTSSSTKLASNVQSFDPNSVNQWWNTGQAPSYSWVFGLAVVAGVVIVAAAFAVSLTRRRHRSARSVTHPSPLASAVHFCPNCGSPVGEGERFCGACGSQL